MLSPIVPIHTKPVKPVLSSHKPTQARTEPVEQQQHQSVEPVGLARIIATATKLLGLDQLLDDDDDELVNPNCSIPPRVMQLYRKTLDMD